MNRNTVLANSILWATAVVASAIAGAPDSLTLVMLPALAFASLLLARYKSGSGRCPS